MRMNAGITTIDQYISQFPKDVQVILRKIRSTIQAAAPDAREKIGYGIPTFTLKGNLVHFAAYPKHIGFYPGAQTIADFQEEIKNYNTSKGTVQFPLDQPIPYDLIDTITRSRVAQSQ